MECTLINNCDIVPFPFPHTNETCRMPAPLANIWNFSEKHQPYLLYDIDHTCVNISIRFSDVMFEKRWPRRLVNSFIEWGLPASQDTVIDFVPTLLFPPLPPFMVNVFSHIQRRISSHLDSYFVFVV